VTRTQPRTAEPTGVLREELRRHAKRQMTGTAGQLRVPAAFLEQQEMPLAPAPEQRRIVAAIDSYSSRLDEAEVALERVQRNLKRYRAAVFQAAVEGRLVPTEAAVARAEGRSLRPCGEPAVWRSEIPGVARSDKRNRRTTRVVRDSSCILRMFLSAMRTRC